MRADMTFPWFRCPWFFRKGQRCLLGMYVLEGRSPENIDEEGVKAFKKNKGGLTKKVKIVKIELLIVIVEADYFTFINFRYC